MDEAALPSFVVMQNLFKENVSVSDDSKMGGKIQRDLFSGHAVTNKDI